MHLLGTGDASYSTCQKPVCQRGLEHIDLNTNVYELAATMTHMRVCLLDYASFRMTKAKVTMNTLLNMRSSITAFIHIREGNLQEVNVLDIQLLEAGVKRFLSLEIRSNLYNHV
jgi:hypothetical protein